jgi:predicted Zn-dependent protease
MKSKLTQSDIQILINNLNLKKYDFVISKSKNFIKKYPREIIFYNLLGISYQRTGKLIESKDIFLRGLKQSPKDISLKNNLAQTYTKLFEYERAEQIYNELIKTKPEYASAYLNLGNQKRDLNQLHDAIKLYEVANKLMPNNHIILYAIALTHRALGNFDDAVKYSKQIIDLNPKFTKADLLISRCITYDKNNWHYKNLIEKTKNRNLTEDEDIDLCYSLSKANEDLKNISQSYEFLKIGNSLRKKRSNYNVRDDIDLINNIENFFKNINLEKISSNQRQKLIFVLGMPRSGTSLVEQIISSHSAVFGGGELPYIDALVNKNFIKNKKIDFKTLSELLDKKEKINSIANEYLNLTKHLNRDNKIFLDKSLLNFMWVGFIKILFPNSKIIHCSRDPKNNCLSIFKNAFGDGLGFAHDEEDLVKFYKAYKNLMDFWKSKEIDNLITIKYEKLINDSVSETKKLINHCELSWEESCLKFYQNKNPIKTISAGQARKPIYKTSLNSFDNYKSLLKVIDKNF